MMSSLAPPSHSLQHSSHHLYAPITERPTIIISPPWRTQGVNQLLRTLEAGQDFKRTLPKHCLPLALYTCACKSVMLREFLETLEIPLCMPLRSVPFLEQSTVFRRVLYISSIDFTSKMQCIVGLWGGVQITWCILQKCAAVGWLAVE